MIAGRTREVLVGVDVGTTNLRCAVHTTSGRVVALASRPAAATRTGGVLDPEMLWQHTAHVIAEALDHARSEQPVAVRGIAVAGVGCVPVFLDRQGVPFGLPPDSDGRDEGLRRLEALTTADAFHARTGYPFDTTTVACRLAAASSEVKARIATAMSVSDFIAWRLTGVLAHERSTAASFALWDGTRGGWWTELIDGIGVKASAFGPVGDSAQPMGGVVTGVAQVIGLTAGTVVSTGGHDYLAAALAAGVGPGDGILDVAGTLEIVATIHDRGELVADDPSIRTMRDHHVVPGQRSSMIEAYAADTIERLRPLGDPGPGAPGDPLAAAFEELDQASLTGDAIRSSLALDLRAAIVALCRQSARMVDHQRDVLGNSQAAVTVVGGGSRSAAWNGIKASILGTPIRVPRIREASALGAALLAGVGAGVYRDLDEATGVALDLGEDIVEPGLVRA